MRFIFAAAFAPKMWIGLKNAEVHGALPFGGCFLRGLEELKHAASVEIDENEVIGAEAGEGGGNEIGWLRVFELGVEGDDGFQPQCAAREWSEIETSLADDEQFVSKEVQLLGAE